MKVLHAEPPVLSALPARPPRRRRCDAPREQRCCPWCPRRPAWTIMKNNVENVENNVKNDQWWSMQLIHVDNYTYIVASTYFGRKGIIILFVRGSSFKIATPTGPASYEQCLCSPRSSVTKKHWPLAWHWNSVGLVYTNKQKEIQNVHHSTIRRKANHINRTKYLS